MIPEKVLRGSVNGITEEGRHVLAMIFDDEEGVKIRTNKIVSLFIELGASVDIDQENGYQHITVPVPKTDKRVLTSPYNKGFARPNFLRGVKNVLAELGIFPKSRL